MQPILPDATTIVTIGMGVLGALFYVASLSMKTVIPLRIAAIASACFFLVYGVLAYSVTTIFLYVILVPLNSLRLYQLIQLIKKVRLAAGQDLSMDWLEPFMTKRKCREGDVLFRKNDEANEMFLAVKGTYGIPELDKAIQPGEIFGELGLLTSEQRRTQSVECTGSGHVLTITYDKVRELYFGIRSSDSICFVSPASASCKKSHAWNAPWRSSAKRLHNPSELDGGMGGLLLSALLTVKLWLASLRLPYQISMTQMPGTSSKLSSSV
jgi:CRP-like cAMP-binding protein